MPQYDRRRLLDVPIEYVPNEMMADLPRPDRFALVLVTDGGANIILNGESTVLKAPCVICLSPKDRLAARETSLLSAQSFSLSPEFLKMRSTFKLARAGCEAATEEAYENDALALFVERDEHYRGVLSLPPQVYF